MSRLHGTSAADTRLWLAWTWVTWYSFSLRLSRTNGAANGARPGMIDYEKAVRQYGSIRKASAALGIPDTTFRRRLAQAREHFALGKADEGMVVRATSTLTDLRTGEAVMQWVKASA